MPISARSRGEGPATVCGSFSSANAALKYFSKTFRAVGAAAVGRGLAALRAHDAEQAAESLRAVWEHMQREGVDDPGAFPVAPDLVEALNNLGLLLQAMGEKLH